MFSNLGIKLVCLLVAALLWAQVASTQDVEQLVQLPVEVVGLADSLAIPASRLPESISVRIRGNRLQLLANDLVHRDLGRVQLDLSASGPGRHRYDVSVLDVRVSGTALEIVPPIALELDVQREITKSVPVRLELVGELPEGVALAGRPEVSPPRVEVTGPQRLVEPIVEVVTEPLRLNRRRASFSERLSLVPSDPDVILRPIEVQIAVGVDEVVERTFEEIPVTVLSELEASRVSLDPTSVRVRVLGAVGVVNALSADEVSVLVPIDADVRGVAQVPAQAVVPDGVTARSVEPPTVQVVVDAADSTAEGR